MVAVHLEQVSTQGSARRIVGESGRTILLAKHVPLDRTVTLVAERTTVRDALTIILAGTGLVAEISPTGAIVLSPGSQRRIIGRE